MTLSEFEELFKGNMVRLNWDRAKRERWRVTTHVCSARATLAGYRTVWTTGGVVGDQGRMVRLGDADLLGSIGTAWRIKVLDLARRFEEEGQPIVTVLPACEKVLLDGNHRAAALMLARCPFRILICSIQPRDGTLWATGDWR